MTEAKTEPPKASTQSMPPQVGREYNMCFQRWMSMNNQVWQVRALAIAAQAFLGDRVARESPHLRHYGGPRPRNVYRLAEPLFETPVGVQSSAFARADTASKRLDVCESFANNDDGPDTGLQGDPLKGPRAAGSRLLLRQARPVDNGTYFATHPVFPVPDSLT
ncbi:hypothetical protein [Arthrobacter sp. NPDC093139]|uniref:hypothetical protein n=1 Tax=Arthrobacter sp. NPDC093139 TaxID=3363945 RepID=UPI003819169A